MKPPKHEPSVPTLRNVGLFFLMLGLLWSGLVFAAVYPTLPVNPLEWELGRYRSIVQFWFPEGWAFFTRDPREPRLFAFSDAENGWRSALLGPHADASNSFGMNRASRAQGVELGSVITAISNSGLVWQSCSESIIDCLNTSSTPADTLQNDSPRPTLCGHVGLALQEPIPWAWSKHADHIVMPSEVINIYIECLHD